MNKKILKVLVPLMLLLSLIILPDTPVWGATTPPTVSSQSPLRGSTGVSVSIQPMVNFSRAMDNTTINATNIMLMNGSTQITATVNLSGTRTAIITPNTVLNYNTAYYIVVTTGVKDTLGTALARTYGSPSTSGFTTAAPKAPTIISQYPLKGAINVSLAVQPYVIFSKAMDYSTINSSTVQLMQNGTPVAASVALSGTNKAVITPNNPLSGNTVYYISVTTAAKDVTGITLVNQYGSATASRFTTAAAVPPTIFWRYPADNATNVPCKVQPYIVFSKAMDSSTINTDNIQLLDNLTPVAISVTLSNSTRAVITPAALLDYNKTYTVTAGVAVKDSVGNALATPSSATFTTADATPPTIVSQYPADSATGIDIEVQPCIIFSEAIDPTTLNSTNLKIMHGTTVVKSSVASYGAKIVIISPQLPLTTNTQYSIVATTGIKDTGGNAMAANSSTTFTTGAAVLPVVTSQYPAAGSTGISLDVKPCVVFSQEMNPATINSTNILLKKGTSTIRSTVALYGKHTAIITPLIPLMHDSTYYITVTTAAKDIQGNSLAALYGSATISQFVTVAGTMSLVSQYPDDNSTGVSINIQPCLVFSAALDASTVDNTTIQLLEGSTPVASTLALCDDNTVTITPSSPLKLNTVYTLVAATGIKDTDGNALGMQTSSQFTTATANSAPIVVYQNPADSAVNVPVDTQICLVFSQEMDSATITSANIQLTKTGNPVSITVALYGKNTVIITVAGPLTPSTLYSIGISTGVKDCDGNTMALTNTTFTTAGP